MSFKGLTPTPPHRTKLHVFLLTKDISRLLSIIMKLDGISLVMLRAPKYHLKGFTTMSLSRDHDPVITIIHRPISKSSTARSVYLCQAKRETQLTTIANATI